MNEITFCELREKEVINTVDGRKLGRVIDLVMTCNGNVLGLVVPGEKKALRSIASSESLFVPWKCIVKIGQDTLLVSLKGGGNDDKNEKNDDDR